MSKVDTQELTVPEPTQEELDNALRMGKEDAPRWATHIAVNPKGIEGVPGPSVVYTDGTDKNLTHDTRRLQFHPIRPPAEK